MADEVTAAQAATLTGLSERTIRRRILSGQIPARRLSANRYAIRIEDLPRVGGAASVVARLDAVEARVRTLEDEVLALRAAFAEAAGAFALATENTMAPSPDQVRALLEQLGQETERLAPLLGFPSATSAPGTPTLSGMDGNAASNQDAHQRPDLSSTGAPRRHAEGCTHP